LTWLVVAGFSLPLIVMVSGSLKSAAAIVSDPYRILPAGLRWSNYWDAIHSMPFKTYLLNTIVLSAGCVVGTTSSCALVAFGFSRIRWTGGRWLFPLVISTMLLPWHITMIPRFVLISSAGLYNTHWAIILPTFLGDAFYIFLLRQFFLTLPEELFEAGRLDGMSNWGLFRYVAVPLSWPALATVALFQFIHTWNDFGSSLLYLNDPNKFPLAYGLERFVSSYSDQTHLLLAGAVLFTFPIVLLFFFTQQTFFKGIATTGIKG
jgi:multiple sugar transport system permease protein